MPRHRALRYLALLALVTSLAPTVAHAQPQHHHHSPRPALSAQQRYNTVDRPLHINIAAPGEPELWIALVRRDQTVVAEARASEGTHRLDQLVPRFWEHARTGLLYAQLMGGADGTTPIGAPLVLQPMRTPKTPSGLDRDGEPIVPTRKRTYSGIRAYLDKHVVLETSHGRLELRLRPDAAPNTTCAFLELVDGGFYTDTPFHRIVEKNANGHGFIVQAGDPLADGSGGPGFTLDLEASDLGHDFGVVSMARMPSDPNSGGSQFFICLSRAGTAALDGRYTTFAEVVDGRDALLDLARSPVTQTGTPLDPAPQIKRAYTIDAPPITQRPDRVTDPVDGPITR